MQSFLEIETKDCGSNQILEILNIFFFFDCSLIYLDNLFD